MSRYPYGLSPDITPTSTPTKLTKAQKSRARREPSGVFSLFSPPQIQQFREAFSLIDHDGDGLVGEQDLKHIFASLGASNWAQVQPVFFETNSTPIHSSCDAQASPPRALHSTSCLRIALAIGVGASAVLTLVDRLKRLAPTAGSPSLCSSQ